MNDLVFVYGSLRLPAVRARWMPKARHRGDWHSSANFALYDLGRYPGAVRGGVQTLAGAVFALPATALERLDRYEDCPRRYRRERLLTPWGPAWIYLLVRRPRAPRVPGGDWLAYLATDKEDAP